jgi:hypothetical protein
MRGGDNDRMFYEYAKDRYTIPAGDIGPLYLTREQFRKLVGENNLNVADVDAEYNRLTAEGEDYLDLAHFKKFVATKR